MAVSSCGRSPCGERGLKSGDAARAAFGSASLPVRGAWVEIDGQTVHLQLHKRRSPCGERGLKFQRAACPGRFRLVAPRAGSVG